MGGTIIMIPSKVPVEYPLSAISVTRLSRRAIVIPILALAFCAIGCNKQAGPPAQAEAATPVQAANSRLAPLRIVVIQDKSLSTGETRTPQLQLSDLDPIIELLGKTGGELAVGIIHDRSSSGFLRLRIDAPPVAPVRPPDATNPLERRNQRTALASQKEKFEAEEQEWQEQMQQRVADFQQRLEPVLNSPADAHRSPVWDAVYRSELFLSERQLGKNTTPHRYAIYISDGQDDVGARPVAVGSGAKILLVNSAGQQGALTVLQPVCFESIEAAFRFVEENELP